MDIRLLWSLLGYGREFSKLCVPSHLSRLAVTDRRIGIYVYNHKTMRQDSIAEDLQTDKTTVAKSLERLEQKGYLTRDKNPDDGRAKTVRLTEFGKTQFSELSGIPDAWVTAVSACLSKKEDEEFDRLCRKMCGRAQILLENKRKELNLKKSERTENKE